MNRRRKIPFIDRVKQQNDLLLRRLGLPALAVLLIAITIFAIFVNSTSAQIGSTTQAYAGFQGKIGRTLADSTPYWPLPKVASQGPPNQHPADPPNIVATTAPAGAPNIVVFLIDDMGYSDLGPYGSEINTPNIDKLAANGLRFSNFTTIRCISLHRQN